MKPILFNTKMVQAISNGSKTQTRRVEKVEEIDCPNCEEYLIPYGYVDNQEIGYQCIDEECLHIDSIPNNLKYKVGDVLYVKETFIKCTCGECEICNSSNGLIYKADFLEDGTHPDLYTCHLDEIRLTPSLFMKKVDARLFLKVTKVRLERLQDIKYDDCLCEGFSEEQLTKTNIFPTELKDFKIKNNIPVMEDWWVNLWNSTAKEGNKWEDNPYVAVYEFEMIEKPDNLEIA